MRKVSEEFYSLSAKDINGGVIKFKQFKGSVVLIVNTATNCKLPNNTLKNLAALAEKYSKKKNDHFNISVLTIFQSRSR